MRIEQILTIEQNLLVKSFITMNGLAVKIYKTDSKARMEPVFELCRDIYESHVNIRIALNSLVEMDSESDDLAILIAVIKEEANW